MAYDFDDFTLEVQCDEFYSEDFADTLEDEDFEFFEDDFLEMGFDPYMGCYSDEC